MTSAAVSQLHSWHHDDYEEAKAQIHQAVGSLGDIEIFGHQVLVAVYVRPNKTRGGFYMSAQQQKEDVYQGKCVLILKCGPSAFDGDESYLRANFGDMPAPQPGDWVFAKPNDGVPCQLCGDGASRPKGKDRDSKDIDIYDWDGWPCRIVNDDCFIGRINKPHSIV